MCRLSTRNLHNIIQCKNNFKNEKKVRKQRGMDWYDTTKIPSRIDKKKSVFDFEMYWQLYQRWSTTIKLSHQVGLYSYYHSIKDWPGSPIVLKTDLAHLSWHGIPLILCNLEDLLCQGTC